jgi:hypothetical protein
MIARSNDVDNNHASTKHKDEAATSERGFGFKKSSTNRASRNASGELSYEDDEEFKSKMTTDGAPKKHEYVEETTAKALRNARRNFSGDEQLFKNEKAKVCTSADRNGLEFDPKHDAPSKVDLGQKYNEVYTNCQEDVFTGWPGTLELETEKNRLNGSRILMN